MSETIGVVGEALIDRVVNLATGDETRVPGGSPLNVAVGLSRLGHSVHFASQVGVDDAGQHIRRHLEDSGVTLCVSSSGPVTTSSATARVSRNGSVEYVFDVVWEGAGELSIGPYWHVHVGSIAVTIEPGATTLAHTVNQVTDRGATISYDPNVRPALMGHRDLVLDTAENMVGQAHLVKASAEDVAWLYPGWSVRSVMDRWRSLGALVVLITQAKDPVLIDWMGLQLEQRVPEVSVVDTIGAGDAFMAGLLHGMAHRGLLGRENLERWSLVQESEIRTMIEPALQCAAFSVTQVGATSPRLSEVSFS